MRLCWATKGFELDSGKLPNEVAHEVLGAGRSVAVLSGPTFAPRSARAAHRDDHRLAASASTPRSSRTTCPRRTFAPIPPTDITGVEVGGAVKNVLAIGAGLSDGLGFGANTRIALITRGLVEMTRLGVALGARRETFMGLAGLGDLVLTCTDDHSRNRRFGLALAPGRRVEQALPTSARWSRATTPRGRCGGWRCASSVVMPIAEGIYGVLYERLPAEQVVRGLMMRPIKPEFD